MKSFLLLSLCAALLLSACSGREDGQAPRKPGYNRMGLPYADKPPQVKINPKRKQHYQMEVKIKDAPLVFRHVRGSELYQAMNCRYTTSRIAGSTINPQYDILLNMAKVNDTTYVTDFYTDTPLDEDYYEQGVCKWEFLNSSVVLEATGKDVRETALVADVRLEDLKKVSRENSEITIKYFYDKASYPRMSFVKEGDSGPVTSGIRPEELKLDEQTSLKDLFTVELIVKRLEK
ncbi:MAG: hypothetical protein Q4A84_10800 [Neisseria sp.]|uniref:hypothetical protein n=1 Tax=Neisseria sp. TaxID=192066 RepID=UPI0026DB162E|nr:hypothetical protein [Neisseria sp.]MDO4642167.1 hypothetical protein [Neisseria sp.]